MKLNVFIVLNLISTLLLAQSGIKSSIDTIELSSLNSIAKKIDRLNVLYQNEKELNDRYIQILEKTNESLSLNWTPLNTFIGIFSILLTIISVATILLAFGNRSQVNKLLKNKSKDFDEMLDDKIQKAQLAIQDKFDNVEATIRDYFKENKPDTPEAKNFMFDMMGELDEIKKVVNKELMNKK